MAGKTRSARLVVAGACISALLLCSAGVVNAAPKAPFRVLHIMSYHSDWDWNKAQFKGFQDALQGVDVEYRIIEMDTKRKSSKKWMLEIGLQARKAVQDWEPDLVYCNDDAAQEYVAKEFVNGPVPFVFSAVNAPPKKYGFSGSMNVTGVLEHEHVRGTINLMRRIAPDVSRITIITDTSPMWGPVLLRINEQMKAIPEIEIVKTSVVSTYEEFKNKVMDSQDTTDALGLLGIFSFKDATGGNVEYQEVLHWVQEHSSLPDFSFWESRTDCGTLCAVGVSGYEQGFAAGEMARGILVGKRSPASYPMTPTEKGEAFINLARAKKLGLDIDSSTLLSAKVKTTMECR